MNMNYEIKPMHEILKYVDNPDRPIKIDPYTMAKMYKGSNNLYYLFPAVGIKGIEAATEEILDAILMSKKIPIEETKPSPFQRERETIINIKENSNLIVAMFSKEYSLEIDMLNISFDYDKINKIASRPKGIERYEKFFFPIGVLLGEKVRREKEADWYLEKRYGYNPYFEPYLFSETYNAKYDPWYWLARSLLSNRRFDFMQEYSGILTINKTK